MEKKFTTYILGIFTIIIKELFAVSCSFIYGFQFQLHFYVHFLYHLFFHITIFDGK